MKNNGPGPSRYSLEKDEKCGVPMCIYWDTTQITKWITEIGYPQYSECIERNFITGLHLIYLDASALPAIGITDFEHIKDISKKVRELLGLKDIIRNISIAMSDPMIAYMEMKRRTGRNTQNTDYLEFINKHKRWFK